MLVRFGISDFEAVVVEHRLGRVRVAIAIDGASEPIVTSYREADVQRVNANVQNKK